jgi:hypothetical protein
MDREEIRFTLFWKFRRVIVNLNDGMAGVPADNHQTWHLWCVPQGVRDELADYERPIIRTLGKTEITQIAPNEVPSRSYRRRVWVQFDLPAGRRRSPASLSTHRASSPSSAAPPQALSDREGILRHHVRRPSHRRGRPDSGAAIRFVLSTLAGLRYAGHPAFELVNVGRDGQGGVLGRDGERQGGIEPYGDLLGRH